MKYIFVVGGVMSGVGKGIATASIAKILQARGLEVTAVKIDPYVNVDAGTMNPTEHGEVFVLDDGTECDQDLGNYERFLNRDFAKTNYMTTGSVYLSVIQRERSMGYGGQCVEVVPHIPLEVLDRLRTAGIKNKAQIVIVEIGGTAGEYQNILFLEAVRMLKVNSPDDVLLALVSYLPSQGGGGELKTKPTQYAVRTLNAAGLQPDIIIARSGVSLDQKRREKIALHCNVAPSSIIDAPDVESIYDVPVNFEKGHLSDLLLKKLGVRPRQTDLKEWKAMVRRMRNAARQVRIGIVGKYFGTGNFMLSDSYISVLEAVKHAAAGWNAKPLIEWIDSGELEEDPKAIKLLSRFDGLIVPGGFGARGIEGKIAAIRYARERQVPYLGLCYGMQLAVIEFARHAAGLKGAHTTEVSPKTPHPVIDILPEQKELMSRSDYGATMRLGAYPAVLKRGTRAFDAYKKPAISERHRHRFEVNPEYIAQLESKGLVFSGASPDGRLMEVAELPRTKHPFFLGTQFHPELKSRPLRPHPLFLAFLKAALLRRRS